MLPARPSASRSSNPAALSLSNSLGGVLGLTKLGPGTLTIAATNNYRRRTDNPRQWSDRASCRRIDQFFGPQFYDQQRTFTVSGGTLTASGASSFNAGNSGNTFPSQSALANFNGGINLSTDGGDGSDLISVTGGTLNAAWITTGRCSTAAGMPTGGQTSSGIYVNGGVLNVSGSVAWLRRQRSASGNSMRVNSGSITVGGAIFVDNNAGANRWSALQTNGTGILISNDTANGIVLGGPQLPKRAAPYSLSREARPRRQKISFGYAGVSSGSAGTEPHRRALFVGSQGIVTAAPRDSTSLRSAAERSVGLANWSTLLPAGLTGTTTVQTGDPSGNAWNISLSGADGNGADCGRAGHAATLRLQQLHGRNEHQRRGA